MRTFSAKELKGFGLRFAICLLVVGALYLLIFVFTPKWFKHPPPSQQIAILRASLDQIYINQNSIISFSESDSVAYNSLSGLIQQHGIAVNTLKKAYSQAKKQLSQDQQDAIQSIIDRQQQAGSSLQNSYNALSSLLQYDPANDLGDLRPNADHTKITDRVNAATNGLKKLLDMKLSSNLDNDTGEAIKCLSNLKSLPRNTNADKFTTKVDTCEQKYVSLRRVAVSYIIGQGFSPTLRDFMKQKIPKLLKQFS